MPSPTRANDRAFAWRLMTQIGIFLLQTAVHTYFGVTIRGPEVKVLGSCAKSATEAQVTGVWTMSMLFVASVPIIHEFSRL